jgi:predicted HicB family RNase H-like nuclease
LTFRVPRQTKKLWASKARRENLSLAEFVRRALTRVLEGGMQTSRDER